MGFQACFQAADQTRLRGGGSERHEAPGRGQEGLEAEDLPARRFITEEVAKFKCWQASQGAVPYLAALQAMAEKIRREEYAKMEHKLKVRPGTKHVLRHVGNDGKPSFLAKGLQEKEKDALDKLTRFDWLPSCFLQESRRLYFTPKRRRHRGKQLPDAQDPPTPAKTEKLLKTLEPFEVFEAMPSPLKGSQSFPPKMPAAEVKATATPKGSPLLKRFRHRKQEHKVNISPVEDHVKSVAKTAFQKVPSDKLVVGLPFEWASRLMSDEKPSRILKATPSR
ncbi:unnamed protein product [Cladocopium goreaui]|uniref:Glutamyl-tRNA reductase n=1 Tax=Cladocopium goreaui TaxID=2562237 RepID=A0A9P1DCV9_9DINO|nr:unnamed protein product [Cladocopium goreaui]